MDYYPKTALDKDTGRECDCEGKYDKQGVPQCCSKYFEDINTYDFEWEHTDSDGETKTHYYDGGLRIDCPECNKWYDISAPGYGGAPLGDEIEWDGDWEIEEEGLIVKPPMPPKVPTYSKEFKLATQTGYLHMDKPKEWFLIKTLEDFLEKDGYDIEYDDDGLDINNGMAEIEAFDRAGGWDWEDYDDSIGRVPADGTVVKVKDVKTLFKLLYVNNWKTKFDELLNISPFNVTKLTVPGYAKEFRLSAAPTQNKKLIITAVAVVVIAILILRR